MKNLEEKEKAEIFRISENFVRIHKEIMEVEETIKNMELRSSELIQELEICREREKLFTQRLADKYGEGKLDPSGLKWIKIELEDAGTR